MKKATITLTFELSELRFARGLLDELFYDFGYDDETVHTQKEMDTFKALRDKIGKAIRTRKGTK